MMIIKDICAFLIAILFIASCSDDLDMDDQTNISIESDVTVKNTTSTVLLGSWGVRLYVRGVEDLDEYVDKGCHYIARAKEIVTNFSSIGHIITKFKKANKKVILYLNAMSSGDRATTGGTKAWVKYLNKYFDGDVQEAWMNLFEGYINRFAELEVDGYWLDAFWSYPDTNQQKNEQNCLSSNC